MFTVRAPNPQHNGISAGVRFTAGVGRTDNLAAVIYFSKAGYTIVPAGTPLPEPAPEPPPETASEGLVATTATAEAPRETLDADATTAPAEQSDPSPFAPGEPGDPALPNPLTPKPPRAAQKRAPRRGGRR